MNFVLRTLLLIAELLIFASTSHAASGLAMLRIDKPGGEQSYGSAVCTGPAEGENSWSFLTAKHNFHMPATSRGPWYTTRFGVDKVYVEFRGTWMPVGGWRLHDTEDVAVFSVILPEEPNVAFLAETSPKEGDRIHVAGYPFAGQLSVRYGTWKNGRPRIPEGVDVGQSGGGIFNERDEVVGILSGYSLDDRADIIETRHTVIQAWYQRQGWPCPLPCGPNGCPPRRQYQQQPPIIVSPPVQVSPPPPVDVDKQLDPLRGQINALRESLEVTRAEIEALKARPDSTRPSTQELDSLRHEIVILRDRIAKLEARPKPVDGRDGKDGIAGANGRDGEDGESLPSAEVNSRLDTIEAEIRKPFRVQLYDTGKPVSEIQEVNPHGGYLSLDLFGEVQSANKATP